MSYKNKYYNRSGSIGFNRSYSSGYSKTYGYSTSYKRDREDSYSDWNWGSFGSYFYDEDDDKDLYIKSHEGYFTPKTIDVERAIDWKNNTKKNRDLIKEMSRFFYYKMLDDKSYFDEKFNDLSKLDESAVEMFKAKESFYNDLWDKYVPGFSPMEKAMSIYRGMQKLSGNNAKEFSAEDMGDLQGLIDFDDEIYKDADYNELLDTNHFSKKYRFEILDLLSLVKNLGSEFKVQKEVEEKLVANSSIIAKKIMRDYSQMHNIELYQRLMPTFNLKLLTKDLIVNVPVERTEHKQKIIILLDYSGSMNTPEKQKWVVAVLIDRLRYAMREEAEVFFSYFLHDVSYMHFHHIYNKQTALDFWAKFSTAPNGGDTRAGVMVEKIGKEIENKKFFNLKDVDLSEEKPEILILSDGQDSVKTKEFTYKTNALSIIDGPNQELQSLCLDNGGKYVYIDFYNINTVNKQGTQTIKHKKV